MTERLTETKLDEFEFYIDRTSGGFPIWVPVDKDGIVLPFWDHEFNGKLSERVAGKPLEFLHKTLKTLYKIWLKCHPIAMSIDKHNIRNLRDAAKSVSEYSEEIERDGFEVWRKKQNYGRFGNMNLKQIEEFWNDLEKRHKEAEDAHSEEVSKLKSKYPNMDFSIFYH